MNGKLNSRRFVTIIGYILITFTILFLISGICFQIKIEHYIEEQNSKYKIIEGRKRLRYVPLVIYLLFEREPKYWSACYMPYFNLGLKEFGARGKYDQYIVYCYFTDVEIEKYLAEQ